MIDLPPVLDTVFCAVNMHERAKDFVYCLANGLLTSHIKEEAKALQALRHAPLHGPCGEEAKRILEVALAQAEGTKLCAHQKDNGLGTLALQKALLTSEAIEPSRSAT